MKNNILFCNNGLGDKLLDVAGFSTYSLLKNINNTIVFNDIIKYYDFGMENDYDINLFNFNGINIVNKHEDLNYKINSNDIIYLSEKFNKKNNKYNSSGIQNKPESYKIPNFFKEEKNEIIYYDVVKSYIPTILCNEFNNIYDLEHISKIYINFCENIKPSKYIESLIPNGLENCYGVHLRRSDKIKSNELMEEKKKINYHIYSNSINEYEYIIDQTKKYIIDIIKDEINSKFFVVSEDFEYKKYFENWIIENKGNIIQINDYDNINNEKYFPILELFSLSRCKSIIQSTKYSSFSVLASLMSSNKSIINFMSNDNFLNNFKSCLNIYYKDKKYYSQIIKNIIDISEIKKLLNIIQNNVTEKYPQHLFISNRDILNKIINKVMIKMEIDPNDFIYYLDFLVYTEPGSDLGWHTDSSDTIFENYEDIINIGIPLLIKKNDKYITGLKYIDPNKNEDLYYNIKNNLERSVILLEGNEKIKFINDNNLNINDNDNIIKNSNDKFIIYKNNIIIDNFEHIEVGDVIIINSSMLHRTHNEINTSRLTFYIKLCKKNNTIKNHLKNLYIPEGKMAGRISAGIIKYGDDLSINKYNDIVNLLKHYFVQTNIKNIIPELNSIYNNDEVYISSLEGKIIKIDKKICKICGYINNILENKKIPEQEVKNYKFNNSSDVKILNNLIPLKIKEEIILKIIDFAEYINNNNIENIKYPLISDDFNKCINDKWIIYFIDVDENWYLLNSLTKIHLLELLVSSNNIGLEYLYELICAKIYILTKDKDINLFMKNIKIDLYLSNIYPYEKIKNTIINIFNNIETINDCYIESFL
jgi:hypothetical protein